MKLKFPREIMILQNALNELYWLGCLSETEFHEGNNQLVAMMAGWQG